MKTVIKISSTGLLILLCLSSFGQLPSNGESDRIEGKAKVIPVPYIDYDATTGYTIGGGPFVMFNPVKKDSISPSSVAGLFGMYSQNKTFFLLGFGSFYLDEDNYRITTAFGAGEINFQYYLKNPISRWVPYKTGTSFFYVGALRKIKGNLYGGMSYFYTDYKTTSEYYANENPEKVHGIGFELSLDERSNVVYPRNGYFLNAELFTQPKAFNTHASNQITSDYSQYFGVRKNKDVFAARAFAGIGIGSLNFNEQFIVGDNDIRGYSQGRYRGNYLFSVQGEYRYNFYKKFGLVGFAGVATIFKSNNPEDDGKLLPGAGIGFRYTMIEETHSNIGFDIAKGIDDWGFYFRFSESF